MDVPHLSLRARHCIPIQEGNLDVVFYSLFTALFDLVY
jgi:hypothetical protein